MDGDSSTMALHSWNATCTMIGLREFNADTSDLDRARKSARASCCRTAVVPNRSSGTSNW